MIESRVGGAAWRSLYKLSQSEKAISVFLSLCRLCYLRFSLFLFFPPSFSIRWILYSTMVYSFGLPVCSFHLCSSASCLLISLFPISFSHNRFSFFTLSNFLSCSQVTAPSVLFSLFVRLSFSQAAAASITLFFSLSLFYLVSLSLLYALRFHATSLSAWRVRGPRRVEARARPCLLDFGGVSLSDTTHSYRCTLQY